MLMVDVPAEPDVNLTDGVAVIVKSGRTVAVNVNVAVAEWVSEPLVPVNVRLYSPAAETLQETVAMPEPLTSGGMIAPHVSP
jgi:hypothetical protein